MEAVYYKLGDKARPPPRSSFPASIANLPFDVGPNIFMGCLRDGLIILRDTGIDVMAAGIEVEVYMRWSSELR